MKLKIKKKNLKGKKKTLKKKNIFGLKMKKKNGQIIKLPQNILEFW